MNDLLTLLFHLWNIEEDILKKVGMQNVLVPIKYIFFE